MTTRRVNALIVGSTSLVIVLLLSNLAFPAMQPLTMEYQSQLLTKLGTTIHYQFVPMGSYTITSGTSPNSTSYPFDIFLAPSYSQMLSSFHQKGSVMYDRGADCRVQSQAMNLYLTVTLANMTTQSFNSSLVFDNGFATCGLHYEGNIVAQGSWENQSGVLTTHFQSMVLTSAIFVNLETGEAKDGAGNSLGEWPFVLSPNNIQLNRSILLYGLDDTLSLGPNVPQGINGEARVIILDRESTPSQEFNVDGHYIPTGDQVYSSDGMIPSAFVFTNLTQVAEGHLESAILSQETTCRENPSCSVTLRHLICAPNQMYENEVLYVNTCNALEPTGQNLPFSFGKLITNETIKVNGTEYSAQAITNTVVYNHLTYVTDGFPELENIAYGLSGLLLNIQMQTNGGLIQDELPAPLVRTYGITLLSSINRNEFAITLVGLCEADTKC